MMCFFFSLLAGFLLPFSALGGAPDGYYYQDINFGEAAPQALRPQATLASGDQFGKVVSITDGVAAVSSNEMALQYTDKGQQLATIGKVFLFHINYLLQWQDSGQSFTSGQFNDGYGNSLTLGSAYLVVGAPADSQGGKNRGRVYVYSDSPFKKSAELVPEDHVDDDDYFGQSVAVVNGNSNDSGKGMIVVGAYGHNKDKERRDAGCVFVFALSTAGSWGQVGILEPSVPVDSGGFGYSLDAYANTLVVGSYGSDLVYVFEILGHVHACPRRVPDGQEMPEGCPQYSRRNLRDLQNDNERSYYSEWMYEEALVVGFKNESNHDSENKAEISHFGSSVAVYNQSGVVTVAVGCSACVLDDVPVGGVFLFSMVDPSDVTEGWVPEGYVSRQDEPHKRALQQKDNGDHIWNAMEKSSHASQTHEMWFLEGSFGGQSQYEQFGWSIAMDDTSLIVGSSPKVYQQGKAQVFRRNTVSGGSPSFIKSGSLLNKMWQWVSTLEDSAGVVGDKFGYSVDLYRSTAIVGTILAGLQEDGTFGAGAAYVYDNRILKQTQAKAPSPAQAPSSKQALASELTNRKSAVGVTFMALSGFIGFCVMMGLFYGVYRLSGGDKSPTAIAKDIIGGSEHVRSSKQLSLASAMDDSTNSTASFVSTGGKGNTSAYTSLSTTSSHGSSAGNQFKPRQQYVPKGPPKPTYIKPTPSSSQSSPSPVSRNSLRGRGLDDI